MGTTSEACETANTLVIHVPFQSLLVSFVPNKLIPNLFPVLRPAVQPISSCT